MASEADRVANPSSDQESMIIYAAVANWRLKQILVDFTSPWDHKGKCEGIVKESIVPQLEAPAGAPASASRYQGSRIMYSSYDDDVSIIHVCTEDYKVQHSLAFQQTVHDLWERGSFPADTAAPRFVNTLKEQVETFTLNPPKTKFDKVQDKQNQIKDVLIDNMDAVLKRHGQIEVTLDSSQDLLATSEQFKDSSRKVKQVARCQLYKSYLIFACVALVLIGVIAIIICVAAKC